MKKIRYNIDLCWEGALNSYSQIFFSNKKTFAYILLVSSFFDIYAGLGGLLAIFITQFFALFLGYNSLNIRDGSYSYNSLMVGMVLGLCYDFNIPFFLLLTFASYFTFLLTVWLFSICGKRGLPFLSIPFLFAIWILLLSSLNFYSFNLSSRSDSSLFSLLHLSTTEHWVNTIIFPDSLSIYFKSLGAIMFQYNIVAGLLIAFGLFLFSRIAFFLSLIGFYSGFLFYSYFGGDVSELIYSYIGFNFILTTIALGGFFIVPSKKSFMLGILVIPMIALLISSLSSIFGYANLPLYSLPFNIVVLLTLLVLKQRGLSKGLDIVIEQQFSPEKNHYKHYNTLSRFKRHTYFNISLPFMGEWRVSQGYSGDITHKGNWKEALDFDVLDEKENTYRYPGTKVEDYYCYNLPVLAPANGYVVQVLNEIEDNEIGEVNLEDNWGNTVIIKHGEGFYSKLSHFKKNSIKITIGACVKKGDILGNCGNSGRSPEPHLHFQLQTTPYIGSKTIPYSFGYYLLHKSKDTFQFKQFEVPKEGEIISNISTIPLLNNAFHFIPGKTITFLVKKNNNEIIVKWEIFTNTYNRTYVYCHNTKAYAYFINDKTLFYFTDFEGNRKSLLYKFYLGNHKILLGYYKNLEIEDKIQPYGLFNLNVQYLQDLVAPFFHFTNVLYQNKIIYVDDEYVSQEMHIESSITTAIFSKKKKILESLTIIKDNKISDLIYIQKNEKIVAKCID